MGLGITVMLHGGKFIDDDVGSVAQFPTPKHITFNTKTKSVSLSVEKIETKKLILSRLGGPDI